MSQNGQRWNVFRYNNLAHNTLTVNGKYHDVKGFVPVTNIYSEAHKLGASLNMTDLFGGELENAVREVALINEKYLSVIDRVKAGSQPVTVRWDDCNRGHSPCIGQSYGGTDKRRQMYATDRR